tara:strand:+ start:2162 stop:2416 length:255 start_codon:yes stop_codon:yes gene_type:complete
MDKISKIIEEIQDSPQNVKFSDLSLVCKHFFGMPRHKGTSHNVYKTPSVGDPRINIQKSKGGKCKIYQVKQVLLVLSKLEEKTK